MYKVHDFLFPTFYFTPLVLSIKSQSMLPLFFFSPFSFGMGGFGWGGVSGFRLDALFRRSKRSRRRQREDPKKDDEIIAETEDEDLYVERIRIENLEIRF